MGYWERGLIAVRRPLIIGLHLLLIPVVFYTAFLLRFDAAVPEKYEQVFWSALPLLLILRIAIFGACGLFEGWWRYSGLADVTSLVKATTLSSAALLGGLFVFGSIPGLPRSILLMDWTLTLLVFGGARFSVRALREHHLPWFFTRGSGSRTLIIGAGNAADRLMRELRRGHELNLHVVALVDDDPGKLHMRLHGVPVLGSLADLPALVKRHEAKLVIIAMPSATRQQMQRAVEACQETGVPFKTVPSLQELLSGNATLTQVRDVQIDDLLGREAVALDLSLARESVEGKVMMVTGGAGSIGSELARQLARLKPSRLVLVEQAESPLYFIHLELCKAHPDVDVVPVIADVTDKTRIRDVFEAHRPDYVFHAAAYKHVPMMEHNVGEAVRNNVFGTLNVASCAAESGAERFVLISTDKAVNPSSVMGATKRIAERLVLGWPSLRRSGTDFRAVRFGNVLGSDGSVVPLFKRQLAAGGPLTVTHPEVNRFFMTIPEAAQLVLLASVLPEAGGRICMLEMGEPVKIVTLAENLIRLSGLRPGIDVQIKFTGLRPGEKLHEELMSEVEATVPTPVKKIRVVQTDETTPEQLKVGMGQLGAAAATGDPQDLVTVICSLVPECVSPLRDRGSVDALRPTSLLSKAEETRSASKPVARPPLVPDLILESVEPQ